LSDSINNTKSKKSTITRLPENGSKKTKIRRVDRRSSTSFDS
jgi:hypothetical protein